MERRSTYHYGLLLLPLFLIFFRSGFAQKNIDSLARVARTTSVDTTAIDAYYRIAKAYGTDAKAVNFFDKALKRAVSIGDVQWQADIRNSWGIHYAQISAYSEALNQWLACLELRKSMGDMSGVAQIYNNIGILYKNTGEYLRALEYYSKSLTIGDSLNDVYVLTKAYGNLSVVYKIQQDYDQALKYQLKSLDLARKEKDEYAEASALTNLGILSGKLEKYDEAYAYFDASLVIFERLGFERDISSIYGNRARIHELTGKYQEALDDYSYDLKVKEKLGELKDVSGAKINIGRVHLAMNHIDEGIRFCKEGLQLANSVNVIEWKKNACECLSNGYQLKGDYQEALRYHKLFLSKKDSIYNEDNTRAMTQQAMKFEFEKERNAFELSQQRSELEQEQSERTIRIITYASIIGLLLMITVITFIYINYRNKKRSNEVLALRNEAIEKQNKEKEVLLREIHHRVKNNLQIVSSLLRSHIRKIDHNDSIEQLRDLSGKVNAMSLIHQKLYSNEDLAHVDFKEYVIDLCESLFDSYKRSDKLELKQQIDELSIDIDNAIPLGLILNELITNALKHGFEEGAKGTIEIYIERFGDGAKVVVKDNGKGITEDEYSETGRSFGFSLIRSLMKKLGASMEITSEQGTQVIISIPSL